ncbi:MULTISPECIES: peroxide stress protein YaaA [Streptococcus]|uniref:UPF0246 protein ACFPQ3_05560 n=1 Tax=Streptococcus caledonicus TaxID=2614158 RepID=A0ABW0UD28_9STRE|nr:peroxide stress protein YaaA [Streptococcus sp. S784/96/1]
MPLTYLIPTAKEMKIPKETLPHQLSEKSSAIAQEMSALSLEELAKAYKISEAAAPKEATRWQAIKENSAPAYPAISLFNGLMYRHLDKNVISKQSPVYITSSFYGIIHALEPIAEHRHDFHTKIKVNNMSLKEFWRPDYDAFATQQETIVSLLSSEFLDIFSTSIKKQLITVTFMEDKNGQLKTHSTISKKARGAFLSQALTQKARTIADLTKLTFADFHYRKDLSSENQLIFVKKA